MIDYKNLEALYWVVKSGSFEKAGIRLCVTQSAITQRIK
ncbi:MAG: LysR family transcriptional regulator [Spirochaetales bacterium]|nr:LysR family transcriptional regulator [Spirochaetales bacterium]